MNIIYYITGHGYGHAVRSIEIIKKLLLQDDRCHVHIRTAAPEWLFGVLPADRITFQKVTLDHGVLQKNSFHVDKMATLKANRQIIANATKLADDQCKDLQKIDPDAIVSDITPLAFQIARKLSIPAIAVGNFSWDWIYAEFENEIPAYKPVIEFIRQNYNLADILYRLPFYGDMSAFPRIIDVPLVCRQSDADPLMVKNNLGIEQDILLIAMRQNDLAKVDWQKVNLPHGVIGLSTFSIPHPRFKTIEEGCFPFQDLVKSARIVLSKPGYGIVTDCIANQTRLLYIPRNDFAEEPILQRSLELFATSKRIERHDLLSGNWKALEELLQEADHWPSLDLSGADFITKKIATSMLSQ